MVVAPPGLLTDAAFAICLNAKKKAKEKGMKIGFPKKDRIIEKKYK